MGQVEEVKKKNKLLAMIIRDSYECEGVDFITPNAYSQQVAYMHHPAGKTIDAHVHNLVHRNVVIHKEGSIWKAGICMRGTSSYWCQADTVFRHWKKWR